MADAIQLAHDWGLSSERTWSNSFSRRRCADCWAKPRFVAIFMSHRHLSNSVRPNHQVYCEGTPSQSRWSPHLGRRRGYFEIQLFFNILSCSAYRDRLRILQSIRPTNPSQRRYAGLFTPPLPQLGTCNAKQDRVLPFHMLCPHGPTLSGLRLPFLVFATDPESSLFRSGSLLWMRQGGTEE